MPSTITTPDRPEPVKLLIEFPPCKNLTPRDVVKEAVALTVLGQDKVQEGVTRNVGEYFRARGVTPPPLEDPGTSGPGWPD